MSVGDVAGLLAALAFVALVAVLAVPLVKLGAVLDETRQAVKELTDHTVPVVDEAVRTIAETNAQLAKVDAVTTSAGEAAQNVSALTTLVSASVGGPLIKISAFTYAVRRLLGGRKAA